MLPVVVAVSGMAAHGAEAAASASAAMSAQPAAAFLLIDGSVLKGEPRLSGCDRKLAALHRQIEDAGAPNVALIGPTTGEIRAAMLHFASAAPGQPHVVVYCGYAASEGGNIFALGSDTSGFTTLGLDQVSIRAFSRLSPSGEGAVVVDLVAPSTDSGMTPATLDKAAQAWIADPALSGRRFAKVAPGSGDPVLASALVQAKAVSQDVIAGTLSRLSEPPSGASVIAGRPSADVPAQVEATSAAQPTTGPAARPGAPATSSAPASPAEKPEAGREGGAEAGPAGADGPLPLASPVSRPAVRKPVVRRDKPEPHGIESVRRAQLALLAHGFFHSRVTGIDSPATHDAIRRFQAVLGHPVTGVLTPEETKQLGG